MKNLNRLLTTAILLFSVSMLIGQNWWGGSGINGEGGIVTKTLNVKGFDEIGLGVGGQVFISKGNQFNVKVEGQANIIELIETDVSGGKWSIKFSKKVKNFKDLKFHITMPEVRGLAIAGSGKIVGKDSFESSDKMDFSIAGSGTIIFMGSADNAKMSISGSGTVKAEDLKVNNCKVSIAGSGDCYIHAEDGLNVSIAGSGNVRYKGSPSVKSSIAGSGNISKI